MKPLLVQRKYLEKVLMVLTLSILYTTIVHASDQDVLIHNGFATGIDYVKMSKSEKRVYAMGVINGMLLAPFFGAPKDKMKWFESFVENMNDEQVAAILSKYINDNPGRWHEGLHILMYAALKDAHDKSRAQ